jgi:three-Cys-motif partner protein
VEEIWDGICKNKMQLYMVIRMPLPDDSMEKWVYKEHTKVKHEILGKYLNGWARILGKKYNLNIFDCFAGRGEYIDEEGKTVKGSPIIILRKVSEVREKMDRPEKATCVFVENNKNNFQNLHKIVNKEIQNNPKKYQNWLETSFYNDEFVNVATSIIKDYGKTLAPSFFFLDPFGFSGIPFEIIKNILSIKRTEVFINFMVRDVNRFLNSDHHKYSIDKLYGTDNVAKRISNSYPNLQREQALLKFYRDQLRQDADVKYTFPFKINADERLQTTYYLIHCTNHPLGCKLMKEIMYKSGTEGEFGYLGPAEGQISLTVYGGEEKLKEFILKKFAGKSLKFRNVIYETLMETDFVEKHFRKILKELDDESKVSIDGRGSQGGLPLKAIIHFPDN